MQNKKNANDNIEIRNQILKELEGEIENKVNLFVNEHFHQKLDPFIEKKVDNLINRKFDEVFEEQLQSKINLILEAYFKPEDLSILEASIERRIIELINKNENNKNRGIK